MTETDEIAEVLYRKYSKHLHHPTPGWFIRQQLGDESQIVIDLVTESLNKIIAQRNPPPQPK